MPFFLGAHFELFLQNAVWLWIRYSRNNHFKVLFKHF